MKQVGISIDCCVVGHFDAGFSEHERAVGARGENSGEFRTLRLNCLEFRGRKRSFLDVLNHLRGEDHHWTEMPQLGPICIADHLTKQGLKAVPVGTHASQLDRLEACVSEARCVALTTTLYMTPLPASEAVDRVRQINPDAYVVLGGPLIYNLHQDLDPESFLMVAEDMGADAYVVSRSGEATLARLVAAYRDGSDPRAVPNCLVKTANGYVETGRSRIMEDMSPIDWARFASSLSDATAQLRTARSCAFSCSFCDYPIRAGPLTLAKLEDVEAEFEALHRCGVRQLVFVDDTFNVPIRRFEDILRMMIRRGFGFSWYAYFRCSNVRSEETFRLMAESGCVAVFLGIESASRDVLLTMDKKAAPENYAAGIQNLRANGIAVFASFIVGFPGETDETVEETIEFINANRPTFVRAEPWFYNRRSPIHGRAAEFGLKGSGYRWSHRTMDWEAACTATDRIFASVEGSTWMPMYDMDFWILPYLAGKGMDVDWVREYLDRCNRMLAHQLSSKRDLPDLVTKRLEREIATFCRAGPFAGVKHSMAGG